MATDARSPGRHHPGGRAFTGPFATFNLSAGVGDDPVAVAANRRRLATELGVRGVVFLGQVHGTRVAVVDALPGPATPTGPAADAAVTALPGVALAVLAADCVPVLLADPRAGVVGVAHAGRVGAAAGVLPGDVTAMAGLGARRADCEALLGPADVRGLLRGACGDARRGRGRAAGQRRAHPLRHPGARPARRAARTSSSSSGSGASAPTRAAPSKTAPSTATAATAAPAARPPYLARPLG